MNHKLALIACLVLGLLVAPPAAAQSDEPTATSTTTATPSSSSTNSTSLLAVDRHTDLVDKRYNRNTGTLTLTFEADRYAPISLLVIEDTGSSTGSATFTKRYLQPGETTEVQIEAPPNTRVWISTDLSQQNGVVHFVQTTEGSALISGPWTAADVRDAALASASGVALMVLYRLVVERSAVNKNGERVA
ncbi:hypothetical protein [Halobellus inordinatus]|uniref:hypothetical protein n=1 Tax=Halobellus inordinatus TaxID=1126236 RepID=UPI00210D06AC|nr:hypothetical protein [Halobellus inordinatus]